MKSIKKTFGALAVFALAASMVFTGCNPEPKEEEKDYTAAGAEITVNAGESVEIYVKGASKAEFTCDGLTISEDGDEKFTLKADEKAEDATVKVNFNNGKDDDEGTDITVNVYNPVYYVNMTLDETIAAKASTISVYYEGKEDDEDTAALTDTVDAEYTAGAATAVVPFKKAKANQYKYFNNIAVTVKDADGNSVEIACATKYFCYASKDGEDGYVGTMAVKAPVSTKTFTITFDGFTIPGGSVTGVKYSKQWGTDTPDWSDDAVTAPAVTLADDGASATFVVDGSVLTSKGEFYINWTEVTFADKDGNAVTISSGLEDTKKWYSYDGDEWSITATVVAGTYTDLITDQAFTASSDYTQVLTADKFADLSISTIKVVVKITSASEWWASASSASAWATATYQSLTWSDDVSGYTAIITVEDFIAALAENGLYLNTKDDAVGTVSVSYIKK